MKFLTVLAVVVAVNFGLVAADYNTVKVADEEFLLKQKKILNLLYYISQPSLVNPSLYEEGRSYNIEANIESYTNTVNTVIAVHDHINNYSTYYPLVPFTKCSSGSLRIVF